MNARIVAVLVVLLAVLGGAALLVQREDSARRPQGGSAMGQLLLKDLKAADIARIRIVEPKSALTLERKDEGWVIAEREGFPADLAKVRDFVVKMISLKVAQSEPIVEKDRDRLNLSAAATQVEFAGADGKPLARVLVGKKLFRNEPDNPEKAPGDGRFVMLPGDDKQVFMVPDPLVQATTKTAEWIDRRSFQIEKVRTLEVRYPDGEGWRLERAGENAAWKLGELKPGEQVDSSRANAATYSLGMLDLADVAPKDASPQATGLDKPIRLSATTFGKLSYAVRIGKLEGENYYVKLDSGGAEKDGIFTEHVVLVPKSRLEDTLKKRAELTEKKDTKK